MSLADVLARDVAQVADVRRALRSHVRRLVICDSTGAWRATAVVADTLASSAGVEAEQHLLCELWRRSSEPVRGSLPRPLSLATHRGRPVLLLTAPPTDAQPPAITGLSPRDEAEGALSWLRRWWDATAAGAGPSGFGAVTTTALLVAGAGLRTVHAVADAQARLHRLRVPQAAEHGCYCRDHARFRGGEVAWVDDWSLGQLSGEPLRDLASYALSMAGRDVAGALRSGELGGAVRDLLRGGLGQLRLPRRLWPDLLVLGLAERVARTTGDVRAALARLEGITESSETTP